MLPFSHYLYTFYFLLCIYAAPKMPVNVSFHPLMLICSASQSSLQGDLKNLLVFLMCFIYCQNMQDPATMIEQQASCFLLSLLVLLHLCCAIFQLSCVRDCEEKWENKVLLMTEPRLQNCFPEQMMINLITIRANVKSLLFCFAFPQRQLEEAGGEDSENRLQQG